MTSVVLIVLGAIAGPIACAQAGPSSLTLDDAMARAFAANPGLRAAGYDVDAERARRDAAALATPLVLGVEIENFAGTDTLGGFGATENTLQLSKVLERGDRRTLRAGLGDARVARASTERSLARLDLAAEVARRFVRVVVDQQRLALAREAVEIATETRDVVRRRVDAGSSSEAELATAENTLAQAGLDRTALESRLESGRVSLATLWADTSPGFEVAEAELLGLPAVEPFEVLQQRLVQSPDLLRLVSEQRIVEAEQRLAESRRRSDLTVGFGLRHLAGPGDTGFMVSVSMPVGSRARATPSVDEASANRARLPEVTAQRRLDLTAVLYELYNEIVVARGRLSALQTTLVPRGEHAVELYRRGFELGSHSLLELSQAQQELLALRRGAVTAAADFHLTLIDIEQLLGGIDTTGESP